ncbi:MAG: ribosome maturation factor RimM [Azospirillaceae bacterium]
MTGKSEDGRGDTPSRPQLVEVGVIAAPHGVRGLVKLKSFTAEPAAIAGYGPLVDATGRRRIRLAILSEAKGQFIVRIEGVADRDAAERLRGTRLFVERDRLPPPEEADEFYHADLIGLAAVDAAGRTIGTVRAIHDFGAGDLLEIARPDSGTIILPFTRDTVPEIDLTAGRLVVVEPAERE